MLRRLVHFNSDPRFTWSSDEGKRAIRQGGWIKVDTDGDDRPDTYVPGTSNFVPAVPDGKAVMHDAFATSDAHGVP